MLEQSTYHAYEANSAACPVLGLASEKGWQLADPASAAVSEAADQGVAHLFAGAKITSRDYDIQCASFQRANGTSFFLVLRLKTEILNLIVHRSLERNFAVRSWSVRANEKTIPAGES